MHRAHQDRLHNRDVRREGDAQPEQPLLHEPGRALAFKGSRGQQSGDQEQQRDEQQHERPHDDEEDTTE